MSSLIEDFEKLLEGYKKRKAHLEIFLSTNYVEMLFNTQNEAIESAKAAMAKNNYDLASKITYDGLKQLNSIKVKLKSQSKNRIKYYKELSELEFKIGELSNLIWLNTRFSAKKGKE